jgi:hypothetical protein
MPEQHFAANAASMRQKVMAVSTVTALTAGSGMNIIALNAVSAMKIVTMKQKLILTLMMQTETVRFAGIIRMASRL